MSTNKILLKFAKKGINLSPEAYNKVINAENPIDFASSLIVKLKSDKFTSKDLVSVSGEIVDEITGNPITEKDNQETLIENQTKPKTSANKLALANENRKKNKTQYLYVIIQINMFNSFVQLRLFQVLLLIHS